MELPFETDPGGPPPDLGVPAIFDRLVAASRPASLLAYADAHMGGELRARLSAEDVVQEALLLAWRDRTRFVWRGLRSFRCWLLEIVQNRIRDLAKGVTAAKRGSDREHVPISAVGEDGSGAGHDAPALSTTPSRVASHREEATAMRAALDVLPPDLRQVVWLRLFEEETMETIATRLQIGVSAAKHRFRRGAMEFEQLLSERLGRAPGS